MTNTASRYYTPTMARLYAEQGYLRKAAEIYSDLVNRHPESEDLKRELAAVEEKIRRQAHPTHKELGLMMREWLQLMAEKNRYDRTES